MFRKETLDLCAWSLSTLSAVHLVYNRKNVILVAFLVKLPAVQVDALLETQHILLPFLCIMIIIARTRIDVPLARVQCIKATRALTQDSTKCNKTGIKSKQN